MTRMTFSVSAGAALLMAGAAQIAMAQVVPIVIKDDPTGGDCAKPAVGGQWNGATLTCTLTQNLANQIQIQSNGITLDGANKVLNGGNLPLAVEIIGRQGVRVRNLQIRNYLDGILVRNSQSVLIERTDISQIGPRHNSAIELHRSMNGVVRENKIHANEANGVYISGGGGNRLEYNTLEDNGLASVYVASDRNWIVNNDVVNGQNAANFRNGIYFRPSNHNVVWGNRIKNHPRGDGVSFNQIAGITQNLVIFNTIEQNKFGGVGGAANLVTGNVIVCNDFSGHTDATRFGGGANRNAIVWNNFFGQDTAWDAGPAPLNIYSYGAPIGGNYWQRHQCVNANGDGFCDAPYMFRGDQDKLPHVNPIPWKTDPSICMFVAVPPPPISEIAMLPNPPASMSGRQRAADRLLVDDFAAANRARDIEYAMTLYAAAAQIRLPSGQVIQGQRAIRSWLVKLFETGGDIGPFVVQRIIEEGAGLRAFGRFEHAPRAALARDGKGPDFPALLDFDIRMGEEKGELKIRSEQWQLVEL